LRAVLQRDGTAITYVSLPLGGCALRTLADGLLFRRGCVTARTLGVNAGKRTRGGDSPFLASRARAADQGGFGAVLLSELSVPQHLEESSR
jgi:hypothetical protein